MKKVKLTKEILTPKEDKLPSKEERKAQKKEQEEYFAYVKKLQEVCEDFFNDTILELDIPFYIIADKVPEFMRSYCVIYKSGSTKKRQADELYEEMGKTPIKDLEVEL